MIKLNTDLDIEAIFNAMDPRPANEDEFLKMFRRVGLNWYRRTLFERVFKDYKIIVVRKKRK